MNKETEKTAIGRLTTFRVKDSLKEAVDCLPTGDKIIDIHLHAAKDGTWISEVVEVVDVD